MTRESVPSLRAIIILIGALSLAGCGSEGVPFVPTDTLAVDAASDTSVVDTADPADVPAGWDWWAGDLLAWRAEPIPLKEVFHGISGVEHGDDFTVYVAGFRGAVLRFDSAIGDWTDVSPATSHSIEGVWAAGSKQAWICGEEGLLMRYEAPAGATYPEWYDETDPLRKVTLNAIHGSGPDDVWAVGDGGLVLRNQGGEGWVEVPRADLRIPAGMPGDLYAVYARGPDDVWVAGQGTVIWWNGIEWDQRSVSKEDAFLSVTGVGDTIWIGSDAGYLWRYNGEYWKIIYAPVYYDYDAIWVDEDGTAFATGEDPSPQSFVWIGTKEPWSQLEVVSPEGLPDSWAVTENSLITGIWGRGPEDLFVCTQQQQILRYATHQ